MTRRKAILIFMNVITLSLCLVILNASSSDANMRLIYDYIENESRRPDQNILILKQAPI